MGIAEQLHDEAFVRPRMPRSEAYQQGALAMLQMLARAADEGEAAALGATPLSPADVGYSWGSPQADAWIAGTVEGQEIWRRWQEALEDRLGRHREVQNDLTSEYA